MPIIVSSFRDCKSQPYDKAYAIVRSYKQPIPGVEQLSELSPTWGLFKTYLAIRERGAWGPKAFRETYVPQFLADLARNSRTIDLLNGLYRDSMDGKTIVLACFCPEEALCHRSIVAGLLQGAGAEVVTETGSDYSMYWEQFKTIKTML